MTRVVIRLDALQHNMSTVAGWMREHGASWTVVVKMLCGYAPALRVLQHLGVRSMADARLRNLRAIERISPDFESWYLRPPHPSGVTDVVALSDVSLNSEMRIIEAIDEEARRQGRRHRIIIMIELGDLREGILPGTLVSFYERVFHLHNVEVLGIGANLGCLAGAVPNVDQFMQLVLYRELLELKFGKPLPLISAGSSAVLPLLLSGKLPRSINHFRIGESLFLGSDLVNGGTLYGLRDDVFVLEAEIAEIKEKSLVPSGETAGISPFENTQEDDYHPGQRGYRALVTIGQLDTDVAGLTPLSPDFRIAGASSDITVLNVGDDRAGLKLGDVVRFRPSYAALLRLMNSDYVAKELDPPLEEFGLGLATGDDTSVNPVLQGLDEPEPEGERPAASTYAPPPPA